MSPQLDLEWMNLDDHIPDLRIIADSSLGLGPPDQGGPNLAGHNSVAHDDGAFPNGLTMAA